MANKYGEAALLAARSTATGKGSEAAERWDAAVRAVYPGSPSLQRKGGPRGAFLGLCETGLVVGIPIGQYVASTTSKTYAIKAVELLTDGTAARTPDKLWLQVVGEPEDGEEARAHTGQMDVVLALWKNGLIVKRAVVA